VGSNPNQRQAVVSLSKEVKNSLLSAGWSNKQIQECFYKVEASYRIEKKLTILNLYDKFVPQWLWDSIHSFKSDIKII
jgi:hypothetical protein